MLLSLELRCLRLIQLSLELMVYVVVGSNRTLQVILLQSRVIALYDLNHLSAV